MRTLAQTTGLALSCLAASCVAASCFLAACGAGPSPDAGAATGHAPTVTTAGSPESAPESAPEVVPEVALTATGPTQPLVQPSDSARSGGWEHFGTDFSLAEADAVACEKVLADPAAYVGHTVRVKGRVADVCQQAGCWLVLTPTHSSLENSGLENSSLESGDSATPMIRVTMKDHAFSVDKQGRGRQADLEGTLVRKTIDPATVAHIQGEAGADAPMPELQSTDGQTYEIIASAVRFRS